MGKSACCASPRVRVRILKSTWSRVEGGVSNGGYPPVSTQTQPTCAHTHTQGQIIQSHAYMSDTQKR